METRQKSLVAADETLATRKKNLNDESPNFLKVLPILLSVKGHLLDRFNLRLTCRAAKAAVDPYLSVVFLTGSHCRDIFADDDKYNAFRRSSLIIAAKDLFFTFDTTLSEKYFGKLCRIPFSDLQGASLPLEGTALKLLPRQKWNNLTRLNLRLHSPWDIDTDQTHLNTIWKSFSEAKWPLESLTIDIAQNFPNSPSYSGTLCHNPGIDHAAHLLSSFPTLERLEINHAAKELIKALQNGALEELKIDRGTDGFFSAFNDVELPALKSLSVCLSLPQGEQTNLDPDPFNEGLSTFFSTARLPCLESLSISQDRPAFDNALVWDVAPACSNQMKRDPYSIFPSLKELEIQFFKIGNAWTKFLASGFYKRGCDIYLFRCRIESKFDIDQLRREVLDVLRIDDARFYQELNKLGIYCEVFWNFLSMEELKSIAASIFMNDFAENLEGVLDPAKLSKAKALGVSEEDFQHSKPNSHLVKSYENLLKSVFNLNSITTVDVNGGASGSVGDGQ